MQGYAPAQWVFGIDTLNGIGVDENHEKGRFFIELSAGQGYEYALDFLIESYAKGNNGFAVDEKESNKWVFVKNLMNPDETEDQR
jgi:TPR repeat protein